MTSSVRNAWHFLILLPLLTGGATLMWSISRIHAESSAPPPKPEEPPMAKTFNLTSPAFKHDSPIPVKYTADGPDVSPALNRENPPQGTKEFVLIMEDPDAPPPKPWVHWVLYEIPADTKELPEAMKKTESLDVPKGALQGLNSWDTIGYRGPAPPTGKVHHYHFQLFALNAPLTLPPGQTRETVVAAMQGHILGKAILTGTYKR